MENIETKSKTAKFGSKAKRVACFTFIFVILLVSCVAILAFLWAGGWVRKGVCSVVLEDSTISEKLECKKEADLEQEETVDQKEGVIEMELPSGEESTEDLITKIVEQASPAVVTVAVDTLAFDYERGYIDQQSGIGSGFVVDPDGLILTNQHVVSDEEASYSVILPGSEEAITVDKIYRDNTNDIAILKINKSGLPALKLGDSDKLKRGNLVVAIGNPFGELEGTSTVGYVTGLNRDVQAGSGFFGSVTYYEGVIQTDAAINPGNSGGPLLNSKGEVIGVNFATTSGADNISFALPINRVKDRLAIFEQEGRFPQPYIGISYSQRTMFLKNNVLAGAVVYEVEKEGPADKAGVKRGDIIVKADDKDLAEYSLANIIQSKEIGAKLALEIRREGEIVEVEVVVGDKGE